MASGVNDVQDPGTGVEQSPRIFHGSSSAFRASFRVELPIGTLRRVQKPLFTGPLWWAHKGSNLGPLPCEGNALPLSYAPGIWCMDKAVSAGRCTSLTARFTECGPMVSSRGGQKRVALAKSGVRSGFSVPDCAGASSGLPARVFRNPIVQADQSDPAGSAGLQKYFRFSELLLAPDPNHFYISEIPSHSEGRCATSTARDGERWTPRRCLDEQR
jgi:hypothetical protein